MILKWCMRLFIQKIFKHKFSSHLFPHRNLHQPSQTVSLFTCQKVIIWMEKLILSTLYRLYAECTHCTLYKPQAVWCYHWGQSSAALPGNLYPIPAPHQVYLKCSAGTSSFNSLQSLELTGKEKRSTSGPYWNQTRSKLKPTRLDNNTDWLGLTVKVHVRHPHYI